MKARSERVKSHGRLSSVTPSVVVAFLLTYKQTATDFHEIKNRHHYATESLTQAVRCWEKNTSRKRNTEFE